MHLRSSQRSEAKFIYWTELASNLMSLLMDQVWWKLPFLDLINFTYYNDCLKITGNCLVILFWTICKIFRQELNHNTHLIPFPQKFVGQKIRKPSTQVWQTPKQRVWEIVWILVSKLLVVSWPILSWIPKHRAPSKLWIRQLIRRTLPIKNLRSPLFSIENASTTS